MRRRIAVLVTFLAGLFYVLEFLLPPTFGGAPDSAGATAPTPLGPAEIGSTDKLLCYTGSASDRPPRLLVRRIPVRAGTSALPKELIAPGFWRRDDYNGCENAQLVGDRLYYIGLGWDDKTPRVCFARKNGDDWSPLARAIMDKGAVGAWDSGGVTWISVLPPMDASGPWRMWYVGAQGDVGRVGFATSPDGLKWTRQPQPVIEPTAGGSITAISVLLWEGSLRAWIVQRPRDRPQGELVTVALNPQTGEPLDTSEPVAWQAPELRFGNLPREAIPIVDARAVPGPAGGRSIILYLSYRGSDGQPRITTAENFPVAGTREPTVFAREVRPLIEPGAKPISTGLTAARDAFDNLLVVVGAFAVGLGLVNLSAVHGRRILARRGGRIESLAFFAAATAMAATTLYTRLRPNMHGVWTAAYGLLFYGLYQPLGSSIFALLAAYMVSAAYRAFRVRNLESAIMAASATLIMLGQVPFGTWLTSGIPHPVQIPTIMGWVMAVMNNGVVRAINFGLFVGAIATALRVWLRLDPAIDRG